MDLFCDCLPRTHWQLANIGNACKEWTGLGLPQLTFAQGKVTQKNWDCSWAGVERLGLEMHLKWSEEWRCFSRVQFRKLDASTWFNFCWQLQKCNIIMLGRAHEKKISQQSLLTVNTDLWCPLGISMASPESAEFRSMWDKWKTFHCTHTSVWTGSELPWWS